MVQQRGGEVGQAGDLGFQADRRVGRRPAPCARPRGVGAAVCGRADEGEQFQQVEGRSGAHAEAAEGGGGVDQDRRRQGAQAGGGLVGRQQQQFAVRGQDGGSAWPATTAGASGSAMDGFTR